MNFLTALFAGDDRGVDPLTFFGFLALATLLGVTIYAAIHDPASWNPATFATAAVGISVATASSKRIRDGKTNAPNS